MKGKLPNVWVSFEPLRISTEHFWASHRYTPAKPAEPPACGCFGPCGNPDCCELCTEPESEPPNNPWDVDRIANVYADEDVSAPGMAKPLARAYLSLKAERDILKLALAEESGYLKRASAERDALKSRLAEESEPRIEHRDVCHASYPCEDCGKVRSRAEGGTTFTVCDDCWDKRQSEPPIADGVGVGIANLFMGHEAETAGKVLARAYLSLKAERDALRAENAAKYEEIASERHSYILLEAERQRLYDGNAALKARVEELEQIMVLHFITHDDDHQPEGEQGEQKAQDFRDECGRIIHRQAADARKEQEASNDK